MSLGVWARSAQFTEADSMGNLEPNLTRREEICRRISVVVPVKDEQESLAPLVDAIRNIFVAQGMSDRVELILIDDGSRDDTWNLMQALVEQPFGYVRALRLRRNFGKAIALEAGFRVASGDIIITMDADLQDDPKEIPRFLEALDNGLDLVSGWKRRRQDPLSKTLPSWLFNRATAWVTGVRLHDFNCGYKAYRREVTERLRLYGELHRYIPVLAHDAGFRVGEIEVEHHPRRYGVTKYGIERYVPGFLDLITVMATTRYLQRPGHLFGSVGLIFGAAGILILGYLSTLWVLGLGPIGTRPLFFLGLLMVIFSIQMISLGVVAELLIRLTSPRDVESVVAADISQKPPE